MKRQVEPTNHGASVKSWCISLIIIASAAVWIDAMLQEADKELQRVTQAGKQKGMQIQQAFQRIEAQRAEFQRIRHAPAPRRPVPPPVNQMPAEQASQRTQVRQLEVVALPYAMVAPTATPKVGLGAKHPAILQLVILMATRWSS